MGLPSRTQDNDVPTLFPPAGRVNDAEMDRSSGDWDGVPPTARLEAFLLCSHVPLKIVLRDRIPFPPPADYIVPNYNARKGGAVRDE